MRNIKLLLLSLCLLMSVSFVTFADSELKENVDIIEQIANGSDDMVGGGIPLHAIIEKNAAGEIVPMYVGGGIDHTHQYLSSRALTILKNDKGSAVANILSSYSSNILAGSDWPDVSENDSLTYKGHFYDPVTGKNYLNETTPTAKTRFVYWADMARTTYNSNRTNSMIYLGRALHYLADLNAPHHVKNMTALNSDHDSFELFVDQTRTNYQVATTNRYGQFTDTNWTNMWNSMASYSSNQNQFSFAWDYTSKLFLLTDSFGTVASSSMSNAQQNMAVFLFKFLQSVSAIQ